MPMNSRRVGASALHRLRWKQRPNPKKSQKSVLDVGEPLTFSLPSIVLVLGYDSHGTFQAQSRHCQEEWRPARPCWHRLPIVWERVRLAIAGPFSYRWLRNATLAVWPQPLCVAMAEPLRLRKYTFHEHWAPSLESFRVVRTTSPKRPNSEIQSEQPRPPCAPLLIDGVLAVKLACDLRVTDVTDVWLTCD